MNFVMVSGLRRITLGARHPTMIDPRPTCLDCRHNENVEDPNTLLFECKHPDVEEFSPGGSILFGSPGWCPLEGRPDPLPPREIVGTSKPAPLLPGDSQRLRACGRGLCVTVIVWGIILAISMAIFWALR